MPLSNSVAGLLTLGYESSKKMQKPFRNDVAESMKFCYW